jgi:Fe-S oxidoreductase
MRLAAHKQALYELRFSTMCKPATEVANLTQLESHTVRARTLMFWRIAMGYIDWGPREAELTYESTLDSISGAFDVFHYPIHEYMLDARADIWDLDLVPDSVKQVVEASKMKEGSPAPKGDNILLASEIAQLEDESLLEPIKAALKAAGVEAPAWVAMSGALVYALGDRQTAKIQAEKVVAGLNQSGARTIIADGPETAWALTKVYPALGVDLPEGVSVKLLSEVLAENITPDKKDLGKAFVHDSRPAYLIATEEPLYTVILPGYTDDETTFGSGPVYEAPRKLLDSLGAERIWGSWTRALARSSGADDGLWLTHPDLAAGLAEQRLEHAEALGATTLVSDSPLAAALLKKHAGGREIDVKLLAELMV